MMVSDTVSVADHFRNEVSGSVTPSSALSRMSSRLSMSSLATVLPIRGGYGGSLNHLIQLINSHTALYYATIASTECYSDSIITGISHRFLLIELARSGKKTIWLRLDRRPSKMVGVVRFVRSAGSTPANDTVGAPLF